MEKTVRPFTSNSSLRQRTLPDRNGEGEKNVGKQNMNLNKHINKQFFHGGGGKGRGEGEVKVEMTK